MVGRRATDSLTTKVRYPSSLFFEDLLKRNFAKLSLMIAENKIAISFRKKNAHRQ